MPAVGVGRSPGEVDLLSLAPEFDEEQHERYVTRLEAASDDPRNRNIALSGRYGTGKSSVLDKFYEVRRGDTVRLAISTLSPGEEALTNRLQKEVLKQLVYSASAETLRHSRFSRRRPMSWERAARESVMTVVALVVVLALLGLLPKSGALGAEHGAFVRWLAVVLLGALVAGAGAVMRMATYNHFVVSEVSAAGTKLKLSERQGSYFDEYLDEIVYFFDQEETNFVIFEDLDRYDNPEIFQGLRELNTLLNNTPKRLELIRAYGRPLRFIYAVRDSLFEQLGEDSAAEADDLARAENVRANRTKFFDVVIPVVPFISHRTARDHLHGLLADADIVDVDRSLVELVARHCTDKRLLVNMRNEYLVFADRLLAAERVAPELTPSRLFALIAYKNFHLEDFERISRRASDLDRLYDFSRELVAAGVETREARMRELSAELAPPVDIGPLAEMLGRRLQAVAKTQFKANNTWGRYTERAFLVGAEWHGWDEVLNPAFWDAVVVEASMAAGGRQHPSYDFSQVGSLDQDALEELFPEALEGRWKERNEEAAATEQKKLFREAEALRGSGLQDLAASREKLKVRKDTLTVPAALAPLDGAEPETVELTFGECMEMTLRSELACDLVRGGYLDRNFTLYAGQFYGDFRGADVATFIVQTVEANRKDINYQFRTPGAFENLLAEAGVNFTRTISAYNVEVVDFLLAEGDTRAGDVVEHLATHPGQDAEQFLAAYFTSGEQRRKLAGKLSSQPWPAVFTYLAFDGRVPSKLRPSVVDAALRAAVPGDVYELPADFAGFLRGYYLDMRSFVQEVSKAELNSVMGVLEGASFVAPTLGGVHPGMMTRLVQKRMYEVTADNLRVALGVDGDVSLEAARADDAVFDYCLSALGRYLTAVDGDAATEFAVRTPGALVDAMRAAVALDGEDELVHRVAQAASADAVLDDVTAAPVQTRPVLAEYGLFRATLPNVAAYRAEVGRIDEHLGNLVVKAGTFATGSVVDSADGAEGVDAVAEAVAILNAAEVIPVVENRVRLVESMGLDDRLPVEQIEPERSNLFAVLLERGLVADDSVTFERLIDGGWEALRPAVVSSQQATTFVTPNLLSGMEELVFDDASVAAKIGMVVLADLENYIQDDDKDALRAATRFAVSSGVPLPFEQLQRIADKVEAALTMQALQLASDLPASGIQQVLSVMPGKYGWTTTWPEPEFDVPLDDATFAVFTKLKDAELVTLRRDNLKERLRISRP